MSYRRRAVHSAGKKIFDFFQIYSVQVFVIMRAETIALYWQKWSKDTNKLKSRRGEFSSNVPLPKLFKRKRPSWSVLFSFLSLSFYLLISLEIETLFALA